MAVGRTWPKTDTEKNGAAGIRATDLAAVLREDLGADGDAQVCALGTRFDLRLAMLEFPLRSGPAEEMRWFVAETDSLSRLREETTPEVRKRFIEETRHWVMRDRCSDGGSVRIPPGNPGTHPAFADLIKRFGSSVIEGWSPAAWEAVALQVLWWVCRNGVGGVSLPPRRAACCPAPPHHLVRSNRARQRHAGA